MSRNKFQQFNNPLNTEPSAMADKDKKEETKPVVDTAPVQPAAITVKTAAVETPKADPVKTETVSKSVQVLDGLLAEYESKLPLHSRSDGSKYDSIKKVIRICDYLNKTTDPDVFQRFLRYFLVNFDTTMRYEEFLCGIQNIQDKNMKSRVSGTYSSFLELCTIRRSKVKRPFTITIRAMMAMGISNALGVWLIDQAAKR